MGARINIVLPEDTLRVIDGLAPRGQRSRFIQRAVEHYVAAASPEAMRERLAAAALRDRDLDLEIARDWSAVGREQWQPEAARKRKSKPASQSGAKSTLRRSTRR